MQHISGACGKSVSEPPTGLCRPTAAKRGRSGHTSDIDVEAGWRAAVLSARSVDTYIAYYC